MNAEEFLISLNFDSDPNLWPDFVFEKYEGKYQSYTIIELLSLYQKETLAELEGVKTTRDQYFKAAIHAQDKLSQAEKEREEAIIVMESIALDAIYHVAAANYLHRESEAKSWVLEKAQQLLTPKE